MLNLSTKVRKNSFVSLIRNDLDDYNTQRNVRRISTFDATELQKPKLQKQDFSFQSIVSVL